MKSDKTQIEKREGGNREKAILREGIDEEKYVREREEGERRRGGGEGGGEREIEKIERLRKKRFGDTFQSPNNTQKQGGNPINEI
jgi:hypothetical protein